MLCQNIIDMKGNKKGILIKLETIKEVENHLSDEMKSMRILYLQKKLRHEKLLKKLGQ